jgi:hypothetical protein
MGAIPFIKALQILFFANHYHPSEWFVVRVFPWDFTSELILMRVEDHGKGRTVIYRDRVCVRKQVLERHGKERGADTQ